MTTRDRTAITTIRKQASELENHVIDEFLTGKIGRRAFLRQGSVIGLSLSFMSGLLAATGTPLVKPAAAATPGGTVRVGVMVPSGAIDPVLVQDTGGGVMISQSGEFLVISDSSLVIQPMLAESWSPNSDGSLWTFKLRKDVKFQDGQAMKADDVVASIDRLTDPANSSNALSVFKGVLSKGGTKKVDDYTVEFHLDAPNGNFPYTVSNDNYNAIILPASYSGDYEKTFIGTGPFKIEKYTPKVGASFVRNEQYWGTKALPDRLEFTFYGEMQPMILAMQGHQLDVITEISVQGGQAIVNDPNIVTMSLKSSAHNQVHMNTQTGVFADKRVRRALALALDREKLVKGLLHGRGSVGNDSPFAPVFPSTNTSIPQRKRNLNEAKQLLEAAGASKGFSVTLMTEKYQEIPDYAVVIQNAAKELDIKIDLKVETASAYYGKAVFGQSDWLDSTIGITDYAHRGVPNVFLSAPLHSNGTWNSAHFANKDYDALVAQYVAALDLQTQRDVAGKIQNLLLDETPVIFAYFYDFLTPVVKNLKGVKPSAMGNIDLSAASFT